MQSVSQTYETLYQQDADCEVRVTISGTGYLKVFDQFKIVSLNIQDDLFDGGKFGIGGTVAKELNMSIYDPLVNGEESIPRMAQIVVELRLVLDSESEWIPQGTYFIDLRSREASSPEVLSIVGYDAMLKGDVPYYPYGSTITGYPKLDITMATEIAQRIGVTLHPSVAEIMTKGYYAQSPNAGEGGYTVRECLGFLGAMYGGNWKIDAANYLRLYVIGSEVSLLANEDAEILTDSLGVEIIV